MTLCAQAATSLKEVQLAFPVATLIHMKTFIAQISAKLTTVPTTYVSLAIKILQQRKTTFAQLASQMRRYLTVQWVFACVKLAFIMNLKRTDV